MKRVCSFFLCIIMLTTCIVPASAEDGKQYTSNWWEWSQAASGIGGNMNNYGCRILAQAQMLGEAGIAGGGFDPDVYAEWAHTTGYFGSRSSSLSSYVGEQAPQGKAPVGYASTVGKTLNYIGQKSLPGDRQSQIDMIMAWLNAGYYVILGSTAHHIYIARYESLQAGTPIFFDSGRDKLVAKRKTYAADSGIYTYARLYATVNSSVSEETNKSGENLEINCTATTLQAEKQSDGSYTLYGSASASGTYLTSVGMYIGTSSSNLQKLGQDSGGTNTSASMWYNTKKYGYELRPGTTYYYRAYAATPSVSVVSTDIKSFTTPADESVQPSITLNQKSVQIKDGESFRLSATTVPAGQTVTYRSSDSTVAPVAQSSGLVAGANQGTATITAVMSYKGKTYTAECLVTVVPSVDEASIELSATSITLERNAKKTISATTVPNNRSGTWSSSDTSVATVDSMGTITAVSVGTATITASMKYNGSTYSASCIVTVVDNEEQRLAAPKLTLSSYTITEGESFTASWTSAGADATYHIAGFGNLDNGDLAMLQKPSTQSLSCILTTGGQFFTAGTYKIQVVATNELGSVDSNTVTFKVLPAGSISWEADYSRFSISPNDATIAVKGTVSGISTADITEEGIRLYDASGNYLTGKSEPANFSGNYNYFYVWYYAQKSLGYTLSRGTTYNAQFYAIANGQTYTSPMFNFTTSN